MKYLSTFLALCFSFTTLSAQIPAFPTHADSPVWTTIRWSFWNGGCERITYRTAGTTQICGKTYEILESFASSDPSQIGIAGYYRVVGDSVWMRFDTICSRTEKLSYNFGLTLTDTTILGYSYPREHWKVGETTQIYEGALRATLGIYYTVSAGNFDPYYREPDTWVRGIGSVTHPFFGLECLGDFCETEWSLEEVRIGGQRVYFQPTPNFPLPCRFFVSVDPEEPILDVNVYVDLQSRIHIQGLQAPFSWTIHDIQGRTLTSGNAKPGNTTIETGASYSPGVYVIMLSMGDQRKWVKVRL